MQAIYETDGMIRIHVGELEDWYHKHPEIFEFRIQEVGDIGWTRRLACFVKENPYGVPTGWHTYAWIGLKPHQAELRDKTLIVRDEKFARIVRTLEGDLRKSGYNVVYEIKPREELIKEFGVPKAYGVAVTPEEVMK